MLYVVLLSTQSNLSEIMDASNGLIRRETFWSTLDGSECN